MKAIVLEKYGEPEDLKIKDVDTPKPKGNEVLVKIHATAINDYDLSIVRGKPLMYRLLYGIRKPKHPILGMEMSGTVAGLGPEASSFKIGDAVYGDISDYAFGTFADYVCINEKGIVKKPDNMTFEEAASLPHAGLLAAQGLIDMGGIQNGQKILINGAGGGVGTLGFQIAKEFDAEVTGVDTGGKLQMMRDIGFDQVIDYMKDDFTKNGQQYDLILDTKTNRSTFHYLKSLNPNGKYITVGGNLIRLLQIVFLKALVSKVYKKKFQILALKANKGLDYINKLYDHRKLKSVIDGPHALSDIPQLLRHFGEGKHQGKIVISMIPPKT